MKLNYVTKLQIKGISMLILLDMILLGLALIGCLAWEVTWANIGVTLGAMLIIMLAAPLNRLLDYWQRKKR